MADDNKGGLFRNVGVEGTESDYNTYRMTPKYNDPYTKSDSDRKIAKFLIGTNLKNQIMKTLNVQNDPILDVLGTGGVDGSSDGRGYFDFLLQSVNESFDEKFQIVETLGDSYAIFGMGKKPRIINCQGTLINSQENDWRINFIKMFEKYISISSMARFRSNGIKNLLTMVYDSMTVRGALLNLRTSIQAQNELATSFSFQMLVTQSDAFNLLALRTNILISQKASTPSVIAEKSVGSKGMDTIVRENTTISTEDSQFGTIKNASFNAMASPIEDRYLAENNRKT